MQRVLGWYVNLEPQEGHEKGQQITAQSAGSWEMCLLNQVKTVRNQVTGTRTTEGEVER